MRATHEFTAEPARLCLPRTNLALKAGRDLVSKPSACATRTKPTELAQIHDCHAHGASGANGLRPSWPATERAG
jgi:hypothetical protein